jgi:hypothetical protein
MMPAMRRSFYLLLMSMMVSAALAQPGQIAIPRVDLMPNQPTPYNVRDWKEVALRYDSLVYDLQRTGQYLPLSYLIPAGVNYPERGSFGLHTYVGTNSPFGNEAINVLPSLVGASLAGIDKRNQFGTRLGADGAGLLQQGQRRKHLPQQPQRQ